MAFDGRDYFDWNLGAFVYNDDSFSFEWYACDPETGMKTVSVPASGWDYAIFFPAFMTDTSLSGNYTYGITYSTGIEEGETLGGMELSVQSNPMSAGSAVTFSVPGSGIADLSLVDMAGRRVATLYHGPAQDGLNSVEFQGDLASGSYLVVLRHENSIETQRVSILR